MITNQKFSRLLRISIPSSNHNLTFAYKKNQNQTSDILPNPHIINFPFYCGHGSRIPDLRGENDLTQKEAFRRMVFLTCITHETSNS